MHETLEISQSYLFVLTRQSNFTSVLVLIKCGELDEWHVYDAAGPAVEADDHPVDGEQKVVIRLLQGLGDRVELTFVRARVVGLRLARVNRQRPPRR